MSSRRYDFATMADTATRRLVAISDRASTLARGVLLLAGAAGVLAYAVGWFTFPSSFRAVWGVGGLLVCFAPAAAVLIATRRLRRIRTVVPETAAELRSLASDRTLRAALVEIVDRDDGHEASTPLVKLGRELMTLRSAVSSHRDQLGNVWQSVVALTTLPGLVAIATIGTFALFLFSAIAVVVRLLLGT
jgi:hypothetical protein